MTKSKKDTDVSFFDRAASAYRIHNFLEIRIALVLYNKLNV